MGANKKESPGITNTKGDPSWRQTELIPKVSVGKFQQRYELAPKGMNSEAPAKANRNPLKESSGIFTPKKDPSCRRKEINSEVSAKQFLRSVQFLRRSELVQKVNHSEAPAGEFHASRTIST